MVQPEDARWYARVLREGPVAPGMAVRVRPRPLTALTRRTAPYAATRVRLPERTEDPWPTPRRPASAPARRPARRSSSSTPRRAGRRNAAALGGHEWEQASAEVGRIEIEIARIERAMDPPRV